MVTIAALPPLTNLRPRTDDRADGAVESFLLLHPGVADLIAESSIHAQRAFGPEAEVILDVPPDYEDEGTSHLYVRILTPLGIDDALDRLDRFNEEWWWNRMGSAPDTLHFTIEHPG